MTEPNLDKILRRIAYWNGYDSAGEWERTGHEVKAQLEEYIADQVAKARGCTSCGKRMCDNCERLWQT